MDGSTLGPYAIAERLGAGGMGEVFKAFDARLDRWVAIKRILPDKEENADHRERLRREARATAKLNHPAIVQVYDIFQEGDSDCIVMEYVEGRGLDRLISEGRVPVELVARLGLEVAEGLAEAHTKGVLHRDLKSENILITPSGHAKILDFGLAKPLRGEKDASLTAHDQMVGTSRALSPEYASGDDIDHRSDLFQLGILLYEASTGHSPFRAHNTLATLKRVILHHQPPVVDLNPEVPDELSGLIDRLLEKEPEDRPQDASEVAIELGRISGALSSGTLERTSGSYLRSGSSSSLSMSSAVLLEPGRRRWWLAGFLVVLAVLLGAVFLVGRWTSGERPPAPAAGLSLMLADFSNLTDEPTLDHSLGEALRVSLEQTRFASVLPKAAVRQTLKRMQMDPGTRIDRELGIEISRREGAAALVMGSIVKVGDAYQLSAELIDPQNDTSLFADAATVQARGGLLPALDGLAQEIRSSLGESLANIDPGIRPLDKVTTPNLEALEAYSHAVDYMSMGGGSEAEAVPLLQRAISLDPDFAMAHAKLGTAFRNLNYPDEDIRTHLEIALANADRLTERERLYVEGWQALRSGTPEEVIGVWSLMSSLYPEQGAGHRNLGLTYLVYRNDYHRAAEAFQRSLEETTVDFAPALDLSILGSCQLALGQIAAALESFRQALAIEGDQTPLYYSAALAFNDRHDEARRFLESKRAGLDPLRRVDLELRLAMVSADEGAFGEALRQAEDAQRQSVPLSETWGERTARLAQLAFYGVLDPELYARSLEEALAEALQRSSEASNPDRTVIPYDAALVKLAARAGRVDDARTLLRRLRQLAENSGFEIWTAYATMAEGEVQLAEGRTEEAIATLEESLATLTFMQGRESLAHALTQAGDDEKALAECLALIEEHGRALVECSEGCFDQGSNVVAWARAHLLAGQLAHKLGQTDRAASLLRQFLDNWSRGQGLPERDLAASRLEALESAPAA